MLAPQILLLGAAVVVSAFPRLPFFEVERRSVSAQGGYALQALSCPVGTSHCQSHWCCPETLTCSVQNDTTVDNICCDGAADCFNALVTAPVCADSSWGLFLATSTAPFSDIPDVAATNGEFCCLPGQVGTADGQCLNSLADSPYLGASSIVPGTAPTSGGSSPTQLASTTNTSSGSSSNNTGSFSTGLSSASTSASVSPSSSPSSHSSSSSLSSNSIIGIAVSVTCSVLGLLIGSFFQWKKYKKGK